MKEIRLKIKKLPALGLEAENISPGVFAGKKTEEIGKLAVYSGNKEYPLSDFFEVSGEAAAEASGVRIIIDGDASRIKWIGRRMSAGEIVVSSGCGMHVGAEISGGRIRVFGDVDAWAGAEMEGGMIEIAGNAGSFLGAAYRGGKTGMKGGRITVRGNAGDNVGSRMAGGTIKVFSSAGEFVGCGMQGGLISVFGDAGPRIGAEMLGGAVVVHGKTTILPSFKEEGLVKGIHVPGEGPYWDFVEYTGDLADGGKGRVYVKK